VLTGAQEDAAVDEESFQIFVLVDCHLSLLGDDLHHVSACKDYSAIGRCDRTDGDLLLGEYLFVHNRPILDVVLG